MPALRWIFFACPAGATAQMLAAGCLLAAMPLRDSWCPVGAVPPCGWGVALAGKGFSTNQHTFVGADILSARRRDFTNLLFPSVKREPFSVLLVAVCPAGDCFFACPAGATAQPLAAVPPYGWGVPLAGKTAFSFVGERGVFYLTVGFLPTRLGPQPSRWRPCRLTDGAYPLRVKPLFLFSEKKKRFWTPKKKR